jgi:hypothetical protein
MGSKRSIRPTNRVQVGSESARVRKCGRRRQGGAWVRTYEVTYGTTGAIRTVGPDLVRKAA